MQLLHAVSRVRIELAHRPALRHGLVAALAVLAGWTALSWSARVESERASWGETVIVLVARVDLFAGDPIGTAVEPRELPLAMVPAAAIDLAGAIGAAERPGGIARRPIAAGAVLTTLDVAMHEHPDALLGPGEVAVAIAERIRSGARVGDRVMVVSDGFVLVPAATVVTAIDDRIVVAVPEDLAAGVAAAALGPAGVAVLVRP